MKGGTAGQLDDVWTRFLAGEPLGRDERCSLAASVRSDDVLHRRLLHDLRLDGALRAAAQGERDGEAFLTALQARIAGSRSGGPPPAERGAQSPRRQRRRAAGMLAVGLLATASVAVLFRPRPQPVRVASPRVGTLSAPADVLIGSAIGQVQAYGPDGRVRPMTPGMRVQPGEWLATVGSRSRVQTDHRDGTEIDLGGDAVVTGFGMRPGTGRVFVARGRIRFALPPAAPAPALEVASPHAVIIADGCFRLDVTDRETRVSVQRRRVRVLSTGVPASIELGVGESAAIRTGEPPDIERKGPRR